MDLVETAATAITAERISRALGSPSTSCQLKGRPHSGHPSIAPLGLIHRSIFLDKSDPRTPIASSTFPQHPRYASTIAPALTIPVWRQLCPRHSPQK